MAMCKEVSVVTTPINGLSAQINICDYAQVADNKLTTVGAGWSFTGPGPVTFGIGILLELEQGELAKPHSFELVLRDADGRPVTDPMGNAVRVNGGLHPQTAPADYPIGMPVKAALAFNFAGLPLQPGSRFQLVLTVDNSIVVLEDFCTRPAQQLKAS
jgi:hypothetical protein